MNTFRHCLADIFSARQLDRVSGAPLYSYKLSEQEYQALYTSLVDSLRSHDISCYIPSAMSSEWAGAFVMYASEWWRKQFSGGHWSWEPIFSSLNVKETDITASQRNKLIAAGFRYWRRPLLTNGQGRMFLGTVAVEGGLPLNLITDPSSKLSNYFEHVIHDFGRFSLAAPNAVVIAEAHDYCIAASFRNEAVYSVVGKIAEAIYQLTDQYVLDDQADPLRYLDAVAPSWPEVLPLNLEHDVARGLLNSALGKAIEVQRRLPSTIRLVRRLIQMSDQHAYLMDDLSEVKQEWKCQLSVSLRSRVNAEYVQQLFGMLNLPSRFSLFALGKKPLLLAQAFRPKNNPERYLLEVMCRDLPDDWFDCEVQLMARSDDGEAWYAPLLGGSSLDSDEPWVFHENEYQWVFYGAGHVCTEQSKALIAINPETATSNGQCTELTSNRFLATSLEPMSRALYMFDEEGSFSINEYSIALGQNSSSSVEYVWQGIELPYQTIPTKCFMGKPRLIRLSSQGARKELPTEKLRWHHASKGQWLSIDTLPFGQSEVAFIDGGKTKKRFRLASLPKDLTIELISGKQLNRGEIKLQSSRPPMVTLSKQDAEHIDFQLTQTMNSVTIKLFSAAEQPPAQVNLELWWQEKPKSIALTLPFPSKGVSLLDGNEQLITNNSELLVDQINAYELHGYGLGGEIEIQFALNARDIRGVFSRSAYFSSVLPSTDALATGLSLSTFRTDIQALFALSSCLDARVKVSVIHHGQAIFNFSLAAYGLSLQPERENNQIALSHANESGLVDCHLFTVPLDHPDQTPQPLSTNQSMANDNEMVWDFPNEEIEAGAWLVYCDNPHAGIRPLMWSKDLELLPEARNGFEAAAGIGRRSDRLHAFSQVAREMAFDFTMTEWKYVRTLLAFDQVPLTTFDLWRGITQEPEFMLALLLNANKKENDRIWQMDKQFPLLWYSLKIISAVKVVNAFYDYLLTRLGEEMEEVAQNRLQKKLSELVSYFPGLSHLNELMQHKIGLVDKKPGIAPAAYVQQLMELRNTLSQRKSLESWPNVFADLLFKNLVNNVNPQLVSLCLTQKDGFKNNVLNAPVLLALASGGQVGLLVTPELVHAMREYRRFDPEFFDDSFALTQKLIIGFTQV
ncbi:STY4851/ECs_5259 family protein [Photobacterium sagamiensis]|uniref:STY4851/ECs_5259 family protein n=1 Tax=Photobacterium sagamiensis TaxID=2910241 RepID=UPI003D0F7449